MQSQYTDKARAALMLAEKAARKLKQNYVGTEHILLDSWNREPVWPPES